MSTTCPCNGVARSEPGIDFIQEVQVQSAGASAEFGNFQGAVFNVVTRQGSSRFRYDASYYGQTAGLTSTPVRLDLAVPAVGRTGFTRIRYRDFTTSLGGPAIRNRLWFFGGYQYLRDYDAQPGTAPRFPRKYEQDKVFLKLNWRLSPNLQLMQSIHEESWFTPEPATIVKSIEATQRRSASVPAMTFGHLTHVLSTETVWEARAGRFVHARKDESLDRSTPSRFDRITGITSGAPAQVGDSTFTRTTAKVVITHYRSGLWGADHQWKTGAEVEKGKSEGTQIIPTGVRFIDNAGQPFQAVSSTPSGSGGMFITAAAFVSDAVTVADRLTITAGVRFDHSRAISQDLPAVDADGQETSQVIEGLGRLYTWNTLSPRLGLTLKLDPAGRALVRASYGRFSQGVLTGEFSSFHPAVSPVTTAAFEPATGNYTRIIRTVDPRTNLRLDPGIRAPNTDEYSIGLDREVDRRWTLGFTYVHKSGKDFIGWQDVGGRYSDDVRILADGRRLPVFTLVNATSEVRFLLTNPEGYSLTYNGVVIGVGSRRSRGWQAMGSYTYSRTSGLQVSSGATAAGAQVSTVAPPPSPGGVTFGRDPNDFTNARGRLPNDRPHVVRVTGMVDVPRTGVVLAVNFQHFSGKPWAATTQVLLPQGDQRILLESRGTRRLSAQSLLDLRVSRAVRFGAGVQADFILDVLNALNDSAEEGLASDDLFSTSFGRPSTFIDPRRAMFSVRLNLGR
ncbi:MAG: TonB-dependent receptor [Vicinamibacterales bacterium]